MIQEELTRAFTAVEQLVQVMADYTDLLPEADDPKCASAWKECNYDSKNDDDLCCCPHLYCHRNWPIDRRAWCVPECKHGENSLYCYSGDKAFDT